MGRRGGLLLGGRGPVRCRFIAAGRLGTNLPPPAGCGAVSPPRCGRRRRRRVGAVLAKQGLRQLVIGPIRLCIIGLLLKQDRQRRRGLVELLHGDPAQRQGIAGLGGVFGGRIAAQKSLDFLGRGIELSLTLQHQPAQVAGPQRQRGLRAGCQELLQGRQRAALVAFGEAGRRQPILRSRGEVALRELLQALLVANDRVVILLLPQRDLTQLVIRLGRLAALGKPIDQLAVTRFGLERISARLGEMALRGNQQHTGRPLVDGRAEDRPAGSPRIARAAA